MMSFQTCGVHNKRSISLPDVIYRQHSTAKHLLTKTFIIKSEEKQRQPEARNWYSMLQLTGWQVHRALCFSCDSSNTEESYLSQALPAGGYDPLKGTGH